jgi:hypothetical protein
LPDDPPNKARTNSALHDEIYNRQIAWLDWLRQKKSLSVLAQEAGRSSNLLTRKVADGDHLSAASIKLLMESTGLPGPDTYLQPGAAGILDEGTRYDPLAHDGDSMLKAIVEAALKDRPNATAWHLNTRALESAGLLVGDVVISDAAVTAQAGNAVVAHVIDLRSGKMESVFRILEPPYLVTATADPTLRKPLLIDNDRVIVIATITESLRVVRR